MIAGSLRIPTDEEIRALHERHAPTRETFELVFTHCEIVCRIAEQFLDTTGSELNADLVRAGCLLHDLGVYRLYNTLGERDHTGYVRHGVLGHQLLKELGFPEALCRFCSCHTGVGLTREDVLSQGLPIPVADYVADSGEEALVMYADKFHSKSNPPTFLRADTYAAYVARFGADKVEGFKALRARFGEPKVQGLADAYGHGLK